MRKVDWRIHTVLFVAALVGSITLLPFVMNEKASLLLQQPLKPTTLFSIQLFGSVIIFAILIYLGLYFGKKVNLGTPLLESYFNKKKKTFPVSKPILTGLLLGIFTSVFIRLFSYPTNTDSIFWIRLLAILYGGITQEILLRLFLMTTLVYAFSRMMRTKKPSVYWAGIICTAFLVSFSNLPHLTNLTTITPVLVLQSIFLNFIPDMVFGWTYWKRGLESTILAHLVFDFFVLVLF